MKLRLPKPFPRDILATSGYGSLWAWARPLGLAWPCEAWRVPPRRCGACDPHWNSNHRHRTAAMRFLFVFVPVCLLAQSGLQAPNLGLMLDQSGFLRPVSGAAGSFVVGEARAG